MLSALSSLFASTLLWVRSNSLLSRYATAHASAFTAASGALTFVIEQPGIYGISYPGCDDPSAGNLLGADNSVTFRGDCAVMQTFAIEQLFQNATDIDKILVGGNSIKMTDITAPLNAEGACVGAELFGSTTWIDYLRAAGNGATSIFDLIADVKGAEQPHALVKGKSGYNKVRDRRMKNPFTIDYTQSKVMNAGSEMDDEYTYVIAAFSQVTGGVAVGADCILTGETDIEFCGRNKWNDAELPAISPLIVMDAQFKLNSAPTGGDNPNWFTKALSWIGGALMASSPFLAAIPAVGTIGAAAAGIGGAIIHTTARSLED
jgi:hypothetical protein